ncbi:MAG: hypothetical protein ACKVQT_38130 [Burkholderiales bacterium]
MMRMRSVVMAIGLAITGVAWSADKHGHSHAPQHGGVVTETKTGDFELVAERQMIQLYIRSHSPGATIDGVTAKVTLLTGGEKTEATLTPAGNKLEAKGTFNIGKGTTVVAVITRAGTPTQSVRFVIK